MNMYEYLDHEADIGLLAVGKTVEETFEQGALGLSNLMVDLETVNPLEEIEICCRGFDMGALFVEWLNAILSEGDLKRMFFARFHIGKIENMGSDIALSGIAAGEPMDLSRHKVKMEVKGATYAGLLYTEEGGEYRLRCVLDV